MTVEIRSAAISGLLIALIGSAIVHPQRRDALRRIVQTQCLRHLHQRRDPAPCERLILPRDQEPGDGYAILHDIKGGVHMLLIPIRTLTGIESPALLDPRAPDYVAAAWNNRDALDALAGRALTRDEVGLAINPQTARGQDQFHIHMECVGRPLKQVLASRAESLGPAWTPLQIDGHTFQARRVMGETLDSTRVLSQVATAVPDGSAGLGPYTLVVAGRRFAAGPGFGLLFANGMTSGEKLLDARCTR